MPNELLISAKGEFLKANALLSFESRSQTAFFFCVCLPEK